MNRLKLGLCCGALLAIMLLSPLMLKIGKAESVQAGRSLRHSMGGSCGVWSVVQSPNPGPSDNALGAVSAVSTNDIWAVGEYLRTGPSSITQTLTEHWNGTNWLYIPSPDVGALGNTLYSVSALSATDAWAVGFYTDSQYFSHTLIEHWNGRQWSIVNSPNPGSSFDNLFGVAALSATDAWAVGFYRNDGDSNATRTLIEHWNGKQWQVASSPNPGANGNLLYGISAASASNIWAVGQYFSNSPDQGLVEHWNGSGWSVVNTPKTGTASNALFAVSASSASTLSVGRIESDITPSTTLAEQLKTGIWNIVPSTSAGPSDNNLYGVTSISANDAWAAGNYIDKAGNARTLIEHGNGSKWTIVSSPSPGAGGDNILGGIVAVSAHDVWAIGGDDSGGPTQTLIEHYC